MNRIMFDFGFINIKWYSFFIFSAMVVATIFVKLEAKKKKIDDEYTVEMFGRRGWICEGCNNFNYESRKKCNRCKIPKKPLKKTVILDNKGNKIIDNIMNTNHKDDWNCYNCGNVNYAFRLNCNRCQCKRENFPNNENETENKAAINLEN